ncbi:hypothetical protein F7725_006403, partial [Dissostichus mawsoni]
MASCAADLLLLRLLLFNLRDIRRDSAELLLRTGGHTGSHLRFRRRPCVYLQTKGYWLSCNTLNTQNADYTEVHELHDSINTVYQIRLKPLCGADSPGPVCDVEADRPFLLLPLALSTTEAACAYVILLMAVFWLMLGFMGVTAFLSMWISNTATTAMMVPIVQAVLQQLHGNLEPEPSSEARRKRSMELEELSDEDEEKRRMSKGLLLSTLPSERRRDQLCVLVLVRVPHDAADADARLVLAAKERAAYEVMREEHRRLGPVSYGELNVLGLLILMVALWFTRDPRFMDGWATHVFNAKAEFVTDATVALFVAVLLFVLPSQPPRFLCFRRSSDTESAVPQGPAPALLTWQVTQKKMPWNIVLLLGGGFALAKGSEMTPLQSIPPAAISVILCLLVATFTECTSNVATATLFLPILASMCQSISLNPLYVMIPCTLSASFAFMLPVATPPNAIVFSSGLLKVSDMAKAGIVMNVVGIGCISLAINTWGHVIFGLDTFPSWANATA